MYVDNISRYLQHLYQDRKIMLSIGNSATAHNTRVLPTFITKENATVPSEVSIFSPSSPRNSIDSPFELRIPEGEGKEKREERKTGVNNKKWHLKKI